MKNICLYAHKHNDKCIYIYTKDAKKLKFWKRNVYFYLYMCFLCILWFICYYVFKFILFILIMFNSNGFSIL